MFCCGSLITGLRMNKYIVYKSQMHWKCGQLQPIQNGAKVADWLERLHCIAFLSYCIYVILLYLYFCCISIVSYICISSLFLFYFHCIVYPNLYIATQSSVNTVSRYIWAYLRGFLVQLTPNESVAIITASKYPKIR